MTITWNDVQPEHRDRLQEQGLPLEDAYACYPGKPEPFPLDEVEAAVERLARATAERDAASEERTTALREAYRNGATGVRLARLAGVSLARISVIVSGAR